MPSGEKQSVPVRVLCARLGCLLRESVLRLSVSHAEEIQPRCAVSVLTLRTSPSYLGPAVKIERG